MTDRKMTGTELVAMVMDSASSSEATTRRLYPYTDTEIRAAVELLEPRQTRPYAFARAAPWLAAIMSSPEELTDEQRDAIEGPLSRMDIAYFVTNYYGADDFERNHGLMPADLRAAWRTFEAATVAFEAALKKHEVSR